MSRERTQTQEPVTTTNSSSGNSNKTVLWTRTQGTVYPTDGKSPLTRALYMWPIRTKSELPYPSPKHLCDYKNQPSPILRTTHLTVIG